MRYKELRYWIKFKRILYEKTLNRAMIDRKIDVKWEEEMKKNTTSISINVNKRLEIFS